MLDSVNSIYKSLSLSKTPSFLTQRERLLMLQKKRTKGLWVQCDDCDRWRHLPDVLDKHELPAKWYCRMHPDTFLNKCSIPEVPILKRDDEVMLYGEYATGSIVLAKLAGWPWWPAMVDDCPDTEQYFWLNGVSDVPTHYHVVFFDAIEVTRAWLTPLQLKPYSQNKDLVISGVKNKKYIKRLEVSIVQAKDAFKLPLQMCLKKYSFIARYKGRIENPHKMCRKYSEKSFKRKLNLDLPEEFSDNDVDIYQNQRYNKHKNVIFLGTKKGH